MTAKEGAFWEKRIKDAENEVEQEMKLNEMSLKSMLET